MRHLNIAVSGLFFFCGALILTGASTLPQGDETTRFEALEQKLERLSGQVERLHADRFDAPPTSPSMDLARLASLEAQVRALRDELSAGKSSPTEQEAVPAIAVPQVPGPHERELEDEAQAADHRRAKDAPSVSQSFDAEPRNAPWAGATERLARAVLRQPDLSDLSLQSVECRSRTCRVEVVLAPNAEPHTEMMLVGALGRILPRSTGWTRDGNRRVIFFQADEG